MITSETIHTVTCESCPLEVRGDSGETKKELTERVKNDGWVTARRSHVCPWCVENTRRPTNDNTRL